MAYVFRQKKTSSADRYHSRRSVRKLANKSRRRFLITLALVIFLIYATLNWILPYFIGGIGTLKNIINPPKVITPSTPQNAELAPPILNIPFEATNSANIDIQGFATAGSRVKLYIDDESIQIIDVSNKGSFTFTNVALNLGTNNLYSTSLDDQEKESLPSKTIKLIFDNDKPSLNITSPNDNMVIQGGDKKVTISGKTDQGIQIFVNESQVIVLRDGNFSRDISINEGENIISIKAIDSASNSTEVERRVTYQP